MGRIEIAYQYVAQAARYCQGANQAPTVDNIRQHLKTGSKSTIARYLREWKDNTEIEKISDTKTVSRTRNQNKNESRFRNYPKVSGK